MLTTRRWLAPDSLKRNSWLIFAVVAVAIALAIKWSRDVESRQYACWQRGGELIGKTCVRQPVEIIKL